MQVVKSVEVRTARPVTVKADKGLVHAAVTGVYGVSAVLCRGVKVHRLVKGGYSVRFLGTGEPVAYVTGTAFLMVADTSGHFKGVYVSSLFD